MTYSALSLLKPRIRKDNLTRVAHELTSLIKTRGKKKFYSYRASDKGQAVFFIKHLREQRVIVKVSYANNTASRSWAAHGKYLQREHAQIEGKKGLGFNQESEEIDLKETLEEWQKAGDERFFKIILSPECTIKLDLQSHARTLMKKVEQDLRTKLEWVAIDHHNTEQGHVHLLIRGIDENRRGLTIDPTYIAEGFRHRSQEIATLKLGLRTERDMSLARSRQIEKSYMTELDRSILLRSFEGVVNYAGELPKTDLAKERRLQEIKRLKFLETLRLAEKIGDKLWRLSPNIEKTLKAMQLSNDIIKCRAQHGLSMVDYPDLLKQTELQPDSPVLGKVIGMHLQATSPMVVNNTAPLCEIDSQAFTDVDRGIQARAKNHFISFETPIPYAPIERKRRLQAIKRLKFLEKMGLAEKISDKRWKLSEDMRQVLRSLSRERAKNPVLSAENHPLTGKVVGVGLEDALQDRRYLLLEGTDGKIHYIRATESIIKARDQLRFKNNDIITLSRKSFTTDANEHVSFIHVNNHRCLDNMLSQKISVIDDEVIQYVKRYQTSPSLDPKMSPFSQAFSQALIARFDEFQQQGLFVRAGDKLTLSSDYASRLDDIQHRRFGNFEVWQPHLTHQQKDLTLAGTIVASNDRVLLMLDLRGQYYRIANRSLGLEVPLKVGSAIYTHLHKMPTLELTHTDKRLIQYFQSVGYSPKQHTQELLRELNKPNACLKSSEEVDRFVLSHQRRADTWLKMGVVVLEQGVYKLAPQMADKLQKESISLAYSMKTRLEELRQTYEKAIERKPCLFNLLTEKSLNTDPKKIVLLDRILNDIGLPPNDDQTKLYQYLQHRSALWKSRGIELTQDFEKHARQWLADSQTLEQVVHRLQKPLMLIQEKSLQSYQGKVIAMGTLDKMDTPHLLIETKKSLLAFPMSENRLLKYTLHQAISLQYCYQSPAQKYILQRKRAISKDMNHHRD